MPGAPGRGLRTARRGLRDRRRSLLRRELRPMIADRQRHPATGRRFTYEVPVCAGIDNVYVVRNSEPTRARAITAAIRHMEAERPADGEFVYVESRYVA